MTTPKPSRLSAMSPAERKRLAEEVRKQAAAREIHEHVKGLTPRQAKIYAKYTGEDGVFRIPVRLGNLRGPEGNVFNVIGACRAALNWVDKEGLYLYQEQIDVVNKFRDRTYDETLDMIAAWYTDLDDSINRLRNRPDPDHKDSLEPSGFGDNPIGGFFGQ